MNLVLALPWPLGPLQEMFGHTFMANAFLAATPVALAAGLAGYFVVIRNQVFVTDVLSHMAFTGALAAYAFATDPLIGLFVATIGLGLLSGLLGTRARGQDVATGTLFAWILGLGVLFLSLYTTSHSAAAGNAGVKVLFGSVFGVSRGDALIACGIGLSVAIAIAVAARPLLFATLDPEVAAARGVAVRGLGLGFIALVALIVAEAVQVVGSLLIVGLMVTPAAAAAQLSARPFQALALSALIAVGASWFGLTAAYFAQSLPPSFVIIALAFAAYVSALLFRAQPWRRATVTAH